MDLINILRFINVRYGVNVNEMKSKAIYHVVLVEIVEKDE